MPDRYSDGYDAIRRMLDGYDSDEIARMLMNEEHWPLMKPDSAAARVRACNNRDSDQYWKWSELIALMEWTQRYDPLHYACDVLGLERPQPRGTDPEVDRILQELRELDSTRESLIRRLRALLGDGTERNADPVDELGTPMSVRRSRFARGDR